MRTTFIHVLTIIAMFAWNWTIYSIWRQNDLLLTKTQNKQ